MEKNNIRFQAKYRQIEENEVRFEEINCKDADYLIVAFGSMARIGQKAMELAREEGIKVGIPSGPSQPKLLPHTQKK